MSINLKFTPLFCLIVAPLFLFGQINGIVATPEYPLDYFRNPLDIPIFLAGNFGEVRPGHFHSGTDIKTLGMENQPVHAAADGYISRIKMEKGGFGHGLYITHPNGYTTLYAHLNDFAPAIQKYLRTQQYEKKRWDVDLQLSPAQFPVKKGQLIAYSGNTGASTAPHLHFEIRNTKTEHPLNPELFGLPIIDKIAPVPYNVAIYDLSRSIYEQTPIIAPVKKTGDDYSIIKSDNDHNPVKNDTITTDAGIAGIGVNVDDFMEGSDNTIAFLTAGLFVDGVRQCQVRLDDIGYDVTRYVNAYADYKTKELKGKWFQCLFKLPGNRLNNIYPFLNEHNGAISIADNRAHEIKIMITDDRDNTTNILFYIRSTGHFEAPIIGEMPVPGQFEANKSNYFTGKNVAFSLDDRELYDNINFQFDSSSDATSWSDHYMIHHSFVPVHHYFDLKINPNKPVPIYLQNKVAMIYSDGKSQDGRAAAITENGWYKAAVRDFGNYWLDIDTIPPVIKSQQKNNSNLSKAKQITFEVRDAMTSVKSFSGYLDGKWICFEQHGSLFFYKFDEHCTKGKHKLVFTAEDENGNIRTFDLNFVR
jgi:hypothetical protein